MNNYLSQSVGMLCDTIQDLNMIAISESVFVGTPVITNMIPYSSDIIAKYNLGIAKDNWNEDDLYQLIIDNDQ